MTVFISYHRPDEPFALWIQFFLTTKGVRTYLDVLDPQLQGIEGVTRRILQALRQCTHLLALISNTTVSSWWVPFEIGVATERAGRITSYMMTGVRLPDYLKTWPVLYSQDDLKHYAQRYHADKTVLEKSYKTAEARATRIQTAADFHRLLKSDLGQT